MHSTCWLTTSKTKHRFLRASAYLKVARLKTTPASRGIAANCLFRSSMKTGAECGRHKANGEARGLTSRAFSNSGFDGYHLSINIMSLTLVVCGLATIVCALVGAIWIVPHLQVRHLQGLHPEELFDRINEARKTLAQILGGIILLAGRVPQVRVRLLDANLGRGRFGPVTRRLQPIS